ncbi:hypothetical protein [Arthrobacter rhombi]|uniref:hypothetical protein n=1 Tax=Arthrobacter rhombi TaxID=71253 RepID=UPI003FD0CAF9
MATASRAKEPGDAVELGRGQGRRFGDDPGNVFFKLYGLEVPASFYKLGVTLGTVA